MHELKLIVDLMYRGGLNYMRFSVSDTAEYGDYVSGPRVTDETSKATMKESSTDIQGGAFAERWIDENEAGGARVPAAAAAGPGSPDRAGRRRAARADAVPQPGRRPGRPGQAAATDAAGP